MSKEFTPDNIQALSIGEHIRMMPKLYFEKCFSENALDCLPFEVLCHAFDEHFDGGCNEIQLTVWKHSFSIKYDVGMSLVIKYDLTTAERIMTQIGACSNLKKHLAVGKEFCNLGMATINFASKKCKLTTHSEGKKGTFLFENGITIDKRIEPFKSENSWTEIVVEPNNSLFESLKFTSKGICEKAKEINKRLTDLNIVVIDKIE